MTPEEIEGQIKRQSTKKDVDIEFLLNIVRRRNRA
jgi:hypothetical protein